MKLTKFDLINAASAAAAAFGLVLALVGCLILSIPEGIGINLSLSPVVYVGVALIVCGLIGAIVGNVLYNRNDNMNRFWASLSLYVAVIAVLAVVLLVAYSIFIPVLRPANG